MSKHVLSAIQGAADRFKPTLAERELLTEVDCSPSSGGIGADMAKALQELEGQAIYPSPQAHDLFLLASLVYAADTRISRDSESEDSWTREIRLVLPVADPDAWESVRGTAQSALGFLTGDLWTLEFRPMTQGTTRRLASRPEGTAAPAFSGISLFSGGMDSLIGAINELSGGAEPLLVSHASEGVTSTAQSECAAALRREYGDSAFGRARIWLQSPGGLVKGIDGESTTRSRSFLFIAAAALAGSGLGRPFTLRVPENGLIALNVPLDANRVGALSTRTTHPYYLARWGEMLDGLGIPATLVNPFWNKTKGEMAAECADTALLRKLLPHSMSCASPTKGRWHHLPPQHCGHCLPCVIRRAATESAFGAGNDPTHYTLADLKSKILDTNKSEGKQIRSLQLAIGRVRAKPEMAEVLIHKPGSLADVHSQLDELAGVYTRGLEEVGRLLEGVMTRPL